EIKLNFRYNSVQDGTGSVNNVTFSGITMSNVHNPIIIDQNYCNGAHGCSAKTTNAVAISGVTYTDITGTYTVTPVSFVCSKYKACSDLTLSTINLTPSGSAKPNVVCNNAFGHVLTPTTPPLTNCLQ
ncbi:hypothetical protein MIMGU_mgv1a018783mg, partial [Erythranthe guttata]